MNKILLSSLLALFAVGCGGKDSGDDSSGGTGGDCWEAYTLAFNTVTPTADEAAGTWTYDVMLDGWAASVQMDIYQSAGGVWTEFFTLQQTDYDPCGAWDQWGRTLTDSDNLNDYVEDGEYTLNDPTAAQWGNMTWMFTAFDYTDQNVYACVVGGAEPEVYADYACGSVDLSAP